MKMLKEEVKTTVFRYSCPLCKRGFTIMVDRGSYFCDCDYDCDAPDGQVQIEQEDLINEMAWLRSIDMTKEEDIKRAALEIMELKRL